ncbi:MAG: FecR family protein [Pedobacter sp.]|uniref:FecR family protein n=1 Tax=Pedobacter sp. TaxID=1411316 RepID=UPI00356AC04C
MMIDNTLVRKFFRNECSVEEALVVAKYLEENPQILDELIPQELWDEMDETSLMSASKKKNLLKTVSEQIQVKRKRPDLIRSLSIAASLLLILGLGWWIGLDTNNNLLKQTKQSGPTTAYTLVKINYGKEDMVLKIADGSVIYLKPGGEIRYLEQLSKQRRDFNLKGAARFKVAADKTRPFNVYAGGTVTTALGTDFTISSEEDEDNIIVLLYSGKIVVGPDSSMNTKNMKRTYMFPGNKLLVKKGDFSLSLIKDMDQQMKKQIVMPNGQTELTSTEVSFRNQSLDKIFGVLQSDFSAIIQFEKVQVKGMYFTGSFKRDPQTVERILNEIALLNHLNIERKDSTYILLSPQPAKQPKN